MGLPGTITLDGKLVKDMLGLIQGARIDDDAYVTDVSMASDETGVDVTIVIGHEPTDLTSLEEVKRELYTLLTAAPDTEVRVTLDQPSVRRLLARPAAVAGFGWAAFAPAPLDHPVEVEGDPATSLTLANGLTTVVVDAADGTFSVDGVPGYGRLVDGGDHGDTYNYSPPATDTLVDPPDSVTLAVGDRGPVRATRGGHRHLHLARAGGRRHPVPGRVPAASRWSPPSSSGPTRRSPGSTPPS